MLPSAIRKDIDQLSYRAYVTDTLQLIAENTAIPAAAFTNGKSGKSVVPRWMDRDKPTKREETRTAEEIIAHIRERLKEVREPGPA